jgi:invasion protein IalB
VKGAAVKQALAAIACAAAVLAAAATAAAAPKQIAKNGDWEMYVDEDGAKNCYIATGPASQAPKNLSWSPRFYVMKSAATAGRLEPSVFAGYTYQEGSQATVSVGSDSFTLFTDKDGAWIEDPVDEARLVEAMKSGTTMIVKGTSSRGNPTTDTYSLVGVTAAINRLSTECS